VPALRPDWSGASRRWRSAAVSERRLLEKDVPAILAAQAAFYDRVTAHGPDDRTCGYLVPAAAKP
jgi:hypothetical protein